MSHTTIFEDFYIWIYGICIYGVYGYMVYVYKYSVYGCCCCVIVLRPRLTFKVMSGWSVNLTTLFLGRLRPPKRLTSASCTYFRQ